MLPESYSRQNFLTINYCNIAMEKFYNASLQYKKLEDMKFYSGDSMTVINKMYSCIMISIVFSSMCVESFLNNYAAICLGDKFFYDNFDSLSVISKFQLISKFILNSEIDKKCLYYSSLKNLIKNRNSLVHNKSEAAQFSTSESNPDYDIDLGYSEDIPMNLKKYKKELSDAFEGLRAIKELALYFDKHDKNAHAITILFAPDFSNFIEVEEPYRAAIIKKLKISS